jgi:hypothetical protein
MMTKMMRRKMRALVQRRKRRRRRKWNKRKRYCQQVASYLIFSLLCKFKFWANPSIVWDAVRP